MKFNVVAGAIFVCLAVALLLNLPTNETAGISGAWASWMQAIGSIAAIVGAVWVARTEERRRNAEAVQRAELAGIAILTRLSGLVGLSEAVIESLRVADVPTEEFVLRRDDLAALNTPSATEIERLIPVPGDVAVDLIQVHGELQMIQTLFYRACRADAPLDDRKRRAKAIAELFSNVLARTIKARAALIKFLRMRGHSVIEE